MAAPSLATAVDPAPRRNDPRYAINVALDIVALQSGVPKTMPGRCCDLSEVGLGAVVAGELNAGQSVAIELRLPNIGLPLRARALVRYQDRLRCGLQFVGLSVEQREKIRYWTSLRTQLVAVEPAIHPVTAPLLAVAPEPMIEEKRGRKLRPGLRSFSLFAAIMVGFAVFGWWQWQKAWNGLENSAPTVAESQPGQPPRVAQEVMDRQIIYKVEPVYPESARKTGAQGLVVLDAVIASDGTVKSLRWIAGNNLLAQSALDAVREWRYTPYRAGGQALEVETTISIDFKLR